MSRILVAEDSFALANLLDFTLKNAGFEVSLHRTGADACAAAMSQRFDIILLDQQMPRMTGIEVIEHIRSGGPNLDTPTYLCTAKSHEIDREYVQGKLKVLTVFDKPFSPKDLVAALKTTSLAINAS